jgi:hypothetical protein
MFSGKSLSRHLAQVLESEEFLRFFRSLCLRDQALRRLTTPAELRAALKKKGLPPVEQDEILLALVRAYQTQPNGHLNCLLIEVFRPALSHLFHSLQEKRPEGTDLWADLTWTLLNLLWEYPVDRLPRKVAANVQLGILKRITQAAVRDGRYQLFPGEERRPWADEFDFDALLDNGALQPNEIFAGRSEPAPPDGEDLERMEALLRGFVDSGVINEGSFYLILATRVYGRSLHDYASESALSYEAVKKQRKRAERAIREAVSEKVQEGDVPFSDLDGFYGTGGTPDGGHDEGTPDE